MPRKGYHALGEELVVMSTRLPKSIADRVTAHVETLRAAVPWAKLGPSDALRDLVLRGLQSLNLQALPVPTMQGPPQAAHSAPSNATPAPPVPDTPVPQAEAVQSLDTALPRGLGPGDELPPHIRAIADARAHYDKLTLAELAQLLFDRGIYRTQAKDGTEVPVHRGTLQRWLDRARQAGCL